MHQLALEMGRTKAELGRRMSAKELNEWIQYNRIEPFGQDRADLRAVFIAWMIYSVNQPPRKDGGKPMSLTEFRERYWPDWLSTPEQIEERRSERVRKRMKSILGSA